MVNQTHLNFNGCPCYLQEWGRSIQKWSQPIFYCKSMWFFSNAQVKWTPQSDICSAWSSNSSKLLWLSLLHARMKKIQSNMNVLQWSQHYPSILETLKGSLLHNSWWVLADFKPIQAFMVIFVTFKDQEHFSNYKSVRFFPDAQGQLTPHCQVWSC